MYPSSRVKEVGSMTGKKGQEIDIPRLMSTKVLVGGTAVIAKRQKHWG